MTIKNKKPVVSEFFQWASDILPRRAIEDYQQQRSFSSEHRESSQAEPFEQLVGRRVKEGETGDRHSNYQAK